MTGIITFWNHLRGYGFIATTTGDSFFFHVTHFDKNSTPTLGALVEFKVAPPIKLGKQPQAVSVRYVRRDAPDVLAGTVPDSATDALAVPSGN
jgi:cold shock CspA family protein